jgi:hypothetical protein
MAANSCAFGAKAGYNQSGGDYLLVVTTIPIANLNVLTPGTGSGGATTVGSLASATLADLGGNGSISSFFTNGKLLRDMGKTVVSSGRTFRKVQAVVTLAGTATNSSPTFGVNGASATNAPGYATFYLETSREGAGAPAQVVRFM